jgi:membrane-associated phospholipid phosphatase
MPSRTARARRCAALLVAALAAAGPRPAHGAPEGDQLTYDLRVDLPITLGAGAVWLGWGLLDPRLGPSSCRWCASNALDDAVRSSLRWDDGAAAHTASNWLAYAIMPATEIGLLTLAAAQHPGNVSAEAAVNVLVAGEAVATAGVLVQIVKYAALRERPFVHALPADEKPHTDRPWDNNLSFYSGHTSFAFALATASGSVATLRGYRLAPVIWVVGLAAAATTGYLRIASDRHYFTDVLAGAVVGGAVGVAVPYLFHRGRSEHRVALVPVADADHAAIVLSGNW